MSEMRRHRPGEGHHVLLPCDPKKRENTGLPQSIPADDFAGDFEQGEFDSDSRTYGTTSPAQGSRAVAAFRDKHRARWETQRLLTADEWDG